MSKQIHTFAIGLLVLMITSGAAIAKPSATITTAKLEGAFSRDAEYPSKSKFDCSDQIMAIIKLNGFERGAEKVVVDWINPHDEVQERVNMNVGINGAGVGLFYTYIRLTKGKGASIFSGFNPTLSLEEFIGDWRVEINVRGRKLESHEFLVNC